VKARWLGCSSRINVNDVRRRRGDFQFAYYRTDTTSVRSHEARELGIRGSTIVIAGRGAPIKKSISPFLGCDDPLGKREVEKNLVQPCKNEKPK